MRPPNMIVVTVIQPERWPTRTGEALAGRHVLCLGEDRRQRNIETFWFIDRGRRLLMVTGEERR